MCGVLSLILLLFRVSSSIFRAAHLCKGEPASWSLPRGTNAAGTRCISDIVVERMYERYWSCHVETQD